jgi:RecA-family ATPase
MPIREWDHGMPNDVAITPHPWAAKPLPASGNGSSRDLVLTNPASLIGVTAPMRRWIVPEWIPLGATTALYGNGGVGKSLLAQMLCTSSATGRPWLGLATMRCKALAVFCEDDDDELHRRQEAINAVMGIGFNDLNDMRWLSRVGLDNLLMGFKASGEGELRPFWGELLTAAQTFGAQLVILDTAADLFGGNENDRGQVRQFIQRACGRLAQRLDGAVVLCAHPSRDGLRSGEGDGGSTAWNNAVRARIYLSERPPTGEESRDRNARVLSRRKANYAANSEQISLRWQNGAFINDGPASGLIGAIERRSTERVFLDLLDAATADGRPVSDNSRASNYAPKRFADQPKCEGYKAADFRRAMEGLFSQGKIRVVEYGRKHDLRKRIERTQAPAAG